MYGHRNCIPILVSLLIVFALRAMEEELYEKAVISHTLAHALKKNDTTFEYNHSHAHNIYVDHALVQKMVSTNQKDAVNSLELLSKVYSYTHKYDTYSFPAQLTPACLSENRRKIRRDYESRIALLLEEVPGTKLAQYIHDWDTLGFSTSADFATNYWIDREKLCINLEKKVEKQLPRDDYQIVALDDQAEKYVGVELQDRDRAYIKKYAYSIKQLFKDNKEAISIKNDAGANGYSLYIQEANLRTLRGIKKVKETLPENITAQVVRIFLDYNKLQTLYDMHRLRKYFPQLMVFSYTHNPMTYIDFSHTQLANTLYLNTNEAIACINTQSLNDAAPLNIYFSNTSLSTDQKNLIINLNAQIKKRNYTKNVANLVVLYLKCAGIGAGMGTISSLITTGLLSLAASDFYLIPEVFWAILPCGLLGGLVPLIERFHPNIKSSLDRYRPHTIFIE